MTATNDDIDFLNDILDAIVNQDVKIEAEVRMKLPLAIEALKKMREEDPNATLGDFAAALAIILPPSHLGWYLAVLLSDLLDEDEANA